MLRDSSDKSHPSSGSTQSTPAPTAARTTEPRRRRTPPASIFIQAPLQPDRPSGLRVGVIADGTTRGGPNGIARGAERVIEGAERCAERGDVALFAAFILSPQNVWRRRTPFFAALHAEFLRLLEGVMCGSILRGIRFELRGRLDRLAKRNEPAARLARVIELLCEASLVVTEPRLRLVLCVDYDEDVPLELELDLLVRTGMEEPGVLRLSGLRVSPDTMCFPTTKLWRDFTPADLDRALTLVEAHKSRPLAFGFSLGFVSEFLSALSRVSFSSPLRIALPVSASAPAVMAVLDELAGTLRSGGRVAVIAGIDPGRPSRHFGPRRAPILLWLSGPRIAPRRPFGKALAWLAPGQLSPTYRLCDRSAGDVNIHACEATPDGLVDGLQRALQFHAEHPPLHGAARARESREHERRARVEELIRYVSLQPDLPAEVIARGLGAGDRPGPAHTASAFAAKCMLDARSRGLFSGEVEWRRQAFGYTLTAFGIGHGRTGAADWEPASRSLARVMLALASSDEEITDRVFEGETTGGRRARIAASVDYLIAAVRGEQRETPAVRSALTLEAIAQVWGNFFSQRATTAHPTILFGVKRAAEGLYRASLLELSRADRLFTSLQRHPSAGHAEAIARRHAACAPPTVTRHIRSLLGRVLLESRAEELWRELRLWCRLSQVAPSIGAGCALLAIAATEPAPAVPAQGVAALLRLTPLIDHYFRLANDLSFVDVSRGDRDLKQNTFMCLIPDGIEGKTRELACAAALRTCRIAAAWLDRKIWNGMGALALTWPLAARWVERGVRMGRRVYQNGHYDRLTEADLMDILDDLP